jgi:hypothetical protein
MCRRNGTVTPFVQKRWVANDLKHPLLEFMNFFAKKINFKFWFLILSQLYTFNVVRNFTLKFLNWKINIKNISKLYSTWGLVTTKYYLY